MLLNGLLLFSIISWLLLHASAVEQSTDNNQLDNPDI